MLRSIAPQGPNRSARTARRIAAGATGVLIAAALLYAVPLLVNDPFIPQIVPHTSIENGTDYIAWMEVSAGPRYHAGVRYNANDTPDRVLLTQKGDIAKLLAGEPIAPLQQFERPQSVGPVSFGTIDFDVPMADCPPPTGACRPDSAAVIVWLRGDSWLGASLADAKATTTRQTVNDGATSLHNAMGPVSAGFVAFSGTTLSTGKMAMTVGFIAMPIALAAGIWFVTAERKHPGTSVALTPDAATPTAEMLQILRLAGLYVESISRSFLIMALAILGTVVATMLVALPPLSHAAFETYAYMPAQGMMTIAFFSFVPLVCGAIALLGWLTSYRRVRKELARWRQLSAQFDDESHGILGA